MPDWFPVSRFGGTLAALYTAFAVWMVIEERTTKAGGWITLRGMASALITAPVSFPMEMLGWKLDYRRTLDMALAIFICAALVYLLGVGLASLASFLLRGARP
jgi:hypothetical protein